MSRPPITQLAAYAIREQLARPRSERSLRVMARHHCPLDHRAGKSTVALEVIYAGHRLLYLPPTADNHVRAEIDLARYELEEARWRLKFVEHPDQVHELQTTVRRKEQEIAQLEHRGLAFGPRAYRLGRPIVGAIKDLHLFDAVIYQPCPHCHKGIHLRLTEAEVDRITAAPATSVLALAAPWVTT